MSPILSFSKMSGAGNDFIVIDNMRLETDLAEEQIRNLCTRRTGIGADGMILVEPSDRYDFTMKYFNADGRPGSMCGNGGRCTVYFAWKYGICPEQTVFEANGCRYEAHVTGHEEVRLKMTLPGDFRDEFPAGEFTCAFVDTGSPHTIIYTDDVSRVDVDTSGRRIRNDTSLFPEGTNVNFLQITSPGTLTLRTFERGVEAETLACGTGAVAAALMSYRLGKISSRRVEITVKSGDILTVDFSEDMTDVYLAGPAKIVYKGTVKL